MAGDSASGWLRPYAASHAKGWLMSSGGGEQVRCRCNPGVAVPQVSFEPILTDAATRTNVSFRCFRRIEAYHPFQHERKTTLESAMCSAATSRSGEHARTVIEVPCYVLSYPPSPEKSDNPDDATTNGKPSTHFCLISCFFCNGGIIIAKFSYAP